MSFRSAFVAVLCSAILSAGLAVGLGASGTVDAAVGRSTAGQLKGIKAELEKVNNSLGGPESYHTIFQELQQICRYTAETAGSSGLLCGA